MTQAGLALLILEKVSMDELVLWSTSNRGAFVLCALVGHLEQGNADHLTLATALRDSSSVEDTAAATASLKGQQALAKQLDKYLSETDKS
jgi:hypothetical protein